MINVKFYYFNDVIDSDINFLIKGRFNMDYPDVVFTEQIEDEECSIVFEMEMDSVDEMDTFICEEICHETEVYCEITDLNGDGIKYIYDEDDEWVELYNNQEMNNLSEIIIEIQERISYLKGDFNNNNVFIKTYNDGEIEGLKKAIEIIKKYN